MWLVEKLMPRSYRALDYDWTPLSRNPCWLSIVAHRFRTWMKSDKFYLRSQVGKLLSNIFEPVKHKVLCEADKSSVDDLVALRYCKHERRRVRRSAEIFPVFFRFVFLMFYRRFIRNAMLAFGYLLGYLNALRRNCVQPFRRATAHQFLFSSKSQAQFRERSVG